MTSSKRSPAPYRFRDNAWLPGPRLFFALGVGVVVTLVFAFVGLHIWMGILFHLALAWVVMQEFRRIRRYGCVQVERESERILELGESNPIRIHLHNPAPWPVICIVKDDYPEGFQLDQRRMIITVPPQETTTLVYHVRPHRRGRHRFGRIHVRQRLPLGYLIRQHAIDWSEDKTVYPRLKEVRRVRGGVYKRKLSAEGPHSRHGLGRGAEFAHIRDYVPDDEPRWINWTATARRGKLATNVYQPEQGQHVAILLDCGRIMGVRDGELTRLDRAIEAALAFSAIAIERGDQVSLLAFSSQVKRWIPAGRGAPHLQRIIEAVHDLEPDYVESGYRTAMETLAFHHKRRSLVALFTDASNLTFADELIQHIRILQRRHLIMTVTTEDPQLQRDRNLRPREEKEVFHKAIAQQMTEERDDRLNALKRRGVVTLNVAPDQLAVHVIHSYIDIKNRSLL
ncbi:DUF58 domain-containing protein [Desmospora activa]|uniref:Uncharacterized protein (DUF58 family) n=1 Tax=Desmospora activa DSM 45169 TaxID=1121389 RepID=A0A2T4ZAG5_9BACL|nr:DUF58 domain-containing protein [Desmospora activa]PTM58867.1 uncharacterized protein (DUF58 family) [Desmospora activa DSM 45169]